MAGLDVIPESQRKGRPADLFMPWFAANISVLGISWGSWVLGFGISFIQAVIVSVIGVVLSFGVCGLIAIAGKRGSAPTLVLSRAAFGYNGNRISAVISWILTVGWEMFLCVMAVQATATVMGALGFENHLLAQIIALVLVLVLAAGSGILGFDTIMKVQTWITWATAVLTIIYLVLVFPSIDFAAVMAIPAGPATAVIGAGIMLLVGFGFGWINAAADYSRYLPRAASTKGVVGWTTFGAALPCVILVFFGLLLVGSNAELGEAIGADPIGALTTILPTWFLVPFALVAILGLIGGIVMDIYSSGLSLLATGIPVIRPVATAIDGTIMLVGTVVVVFFSDSFFGPFQGFLITLGVVISAWGGVMLADIALRKKDYDEPSLFVADGRYGSVNWGAIASLLLGSFIGWGLVVNTYAGWLSWQGYFLGPLGGREGAWAYSNLGVLVAMIIGFLGYWLTSSKRVRTQELQPSRSFEEA
ncbi:cytosine permease [Schaalia hyovaginalis]|nr:cytosine permease [Schaalia hyovaginalis]MCI7672623.1 cytosine permease [Schaalia hyovaginalis]MDY4491393.1 cytosine permease [Schaalia hyovaginalis]MDY5506100.1 cytosine permease [Schaalia hyovaginalis]